MQRKGKETMERQSKVVYQIEKKMKPWTTRPSLTWRKIINGFCICWPTTMKRKMLREAPSATEQSSDDRRSYTMNTHIPPLSPTIANFAFVVVVPNFPTALCCRFRTDLCPVIQSSTTMSSFSLQVADKSFNPLIWRYLLSYMINPVSSELHTLDLLVSKSPSCPDAWTVVLEGPRPTYEIHGTLPDRRPQADIPRLPISLQNISIRRAYPFAQV